MFVNNKKHYDANIGVINFCLLMVTILFYSKLTGFDFGLYKLTKNTMIIDILFYLYLLFLLSGLVALFLKTGDLTRVKGFKKAINLVIPLFFVSGLIAITGFFISPLFQIGNVVKFYIAPLVFYILPVVVLFLIFKYRATKCLIMSGRSFIVLAVAIFLLGLIFYVIKSQLVLSVNNDTIMQLVLSALCVVFPVFYVLLGCIMFLLQPKNKKASPSKEEKE